MAIIIKANGKKVELDVKKPTLKQMQAWVGGYIEAHKVRYDGKRQWMVMNEEGILKNLPINAVASKIAGYTVVGDVAIVDSLGS